jgi:hypothetical protein
MLVIVQIETLKLLIKIGMADGLISQGQHRHKGEEGGNQLQLFSAQHKSGLPKAVGRRKMRLARALPVGYP